MPKRHTVPQRPPAPAPFSCDPSPRAPTCNCVEGHQIVKVANLSPSPALRLARESQLLRGRDHARARRQAARLQADEGGVHPVAHASLKVKEVVGLIDQQKLERRRAQIVAAHVNFAQLGNGPLEVARQVLCKEDWRNRRRRAQSLRHACGST